MGKSKVQGQGQVGGESETEIKVRLTYTKPPSNKEYRLELRKVDAGWAVDFAYGRIGTTLKTGTKAESVDYAYARQIFDRQLANKLGEGYVADEAAPATDYQPPVAKEDTGLRPQLLQPITLDDTAPFLADAQWCMQPKYDGNRVFLIAPSADAIYGANRKGQKISLPVQVEQWAQTQCAKLGGFVLDGELVGETYFAFDLLESKGHDLKHLAYAMRLSLTARLRDTSLAVVFAETARQANDKRNLLERLQREHAEGAVFKRLDAPYVSGRQPTQVKCKFWESATFIVKVQNVGVRSIELGLLDGNAVVGWGSCTVPSNYPLPKVGALVEVKYLYVDDNVYQPQYKGERTDVPRSDCVPGQLKLKPGSRHATPIETL